MRYCLYFSDGEYKYIAEDIDLTDMTTDTEKKKEVLGTIAKNLLGDGTGSILAYGNDESVPRIVSITVVSNPVYFETSYSLTTSEPVDQLWKPKEPGWFHRLMHWFFPSLYREEFEQYDRQKTDYDTRLREMPKPYDEYKEDMIRDTDFSKPDAMNGSEQQVAYAACAALHDLGQDNKYLNQEMAEYVAAEKGLDMTNEQDSKTAFALMTEELNQNAKYGQLRVLHDATIYAATMATGIVKATPHNSGAQIAQSGFSSDCLKIRGNTLCIAKNFWAI